MNYRITCSEILFKNDATTFCNISASDIPRKKPATLTYNSIVQAHHIHSSAQQISTMNLNIPVQVSTLKHQPSMSHPYWPRQKTPM